MGNTRKQCLISEFKVKIETDLKKGLICSFSVLWSSTNNIHSIVGICVPDSKAGKKPHTIGEIFVKQVVLKIANIMLGKIFENGLSQIPLSNGTINSKIDDTIDVILTQESEDLISSLIESPTR